MLHAKALAQIMRHDTPGLHQQIFVEVFNRLSQRYVDCGGHDRKLRRPQHHHGAHVHAIKTLRQFGEKFGMAWMGEPGLVEIGFRDRVGDKRVRFAGMHQLDAALYGFNGGRRVRCAWRAGASFHWRRQRNDGQGGCKSRKGGLRRNFDHGNGQIEALRQSANMAAIAKEKERAVAGRTLQPRHQRDFRTDAGRIALRERDGKRRNAHRVNAGR